MPNRTREYYDTIGWKPSGKTHEDARRGEDLRPCAAQYLHHCRLRFLDHVPQEGDNMLDFGCGPISDDTYLSFSRNFKKRYCVDFSKVALEEARRRLGDRGVYLCEDLLDSDLADDFFDCSISSYSLYHVDADLQERVVRKLLRVTKPLAPVLVGYGNHSDLLSLVPSLTAYLDSRSAAQPPGPYYFSHPLAWWKKFEDAASVTMHPLRTLDHAAQAALIPDGDVGKQLLTMLHEAEERHPDFFASWGRHYLVVLRKQRA